MVKNIIFDLGGVILDLAVPRTFEEFSKISRIPHDEVMRLFKSSEGFEHYERGDYTDDEFRDFVRNLFHLTVDDATLDACWNAMLLGIPQNKLDLLLNLKERYKIFLLSNTNNIHLEHINNVIMSSTAATRALDSYFHGVYYSHRMGMRKPEPEIFLEVLADNGLNAEETLFLDDNMDNIHGAAAVKIRTAFVNTTNFILDYFHE